MLITVTLTKHISNMEVKLRSVLAEARTVLNFMNKNAGVTNGSDLLDPVVVSDETTSLFAY